MSDVDSALLTEGWLAETLADPATALALRRDPDVDRALVSLGRQLRPLLSAYTETLVEASKRLIGSYDVLDTHLVELMRASIDENVRVAAHLLERGAESETFEAPPAAVSYARRIAQRGIPLGALLRNYRIGQTTFTQLAYALLTDPNGSIQAAMHESGHDCTNQATRAMLAMFSLFIDEVSDQVTSAYELEREQWVKREGALVGHRVARILAGRVGADTAQHDFPYDLDANHLAIVAWQPPEAFTSAPLDANLLLRRCTDAASSVSPGLITAADEREHWVWVPLPRNADIDTVYAALAGVAEEMNILLTVGAPAPGLTGFRSGHQQARQVKRLLSAADTQIGPFATFAELGPIALLGNDTDTLRSWVTLTLGDLARSGEREASLRETLLVFLDTHGSFVATGERLHLHRNSVAYRVQQAEELRGRPIDDRLQVQLALSACKWLGPAVLHG